ncbi:hypothetical protein [Neorhizobium petrolearium]|uniref:hypothetical protein n=1 Tax=Neorhizobium petrolearium TaxID=515361 RepID=UPI003F169F54
MKIYAALTAAALALSGCQTNQGFTDTKINQIIDNARPPSPAIKAALLEAGREALKDPYSIRDAQLTFVVKPFADPTIEVVCVRFNSKNSFGGYAGRSAYAVRLKNNQIIAWREEDPVCYHPRVKWYPFPEISRLKNL